MASQLPGLPALTRRDREGCVSESECVRVSLGGLSGTVLCCISQSVSLGANSQTPEAGAQRGLFQWNSEGISGAKQSPLKSSM